MVADYWTLNRGWKLELLQHILPLGMLTELASMHVLPDGMDMDTPTWPLTAGSWSFLGEVDAHEYAPKSSKLTPKQLVENMEVPRPLPHVAAYLVLDA